MLEQLEKSEDVLHIIIISTTISLEIIRYIKYIIYIT